MLTVEEALDAILKAVKTLPCVRVPLLEARGLVLAEDIFADIDSPPFDNSAVDGFAVLASDTTGASARSPVVLRELETVSAGDVPTVAVTEGACARVMTGAPMPAGADAMVMREDTRETDGGLAILEPARPGDHIRYRGEGVRAGTRVLSAGTRIGAAEIGMLAMMGSAVPLCVRRPRVAVLSTGDELVDAGLTPGPGQIRDSNSYTLAALVAEAGADIHSVQHVRDDMAATESTLRACAGLDGSLPADAIITSGGVSVGDRDFVKPALESIGSLDLWRVKMKPGKPVAFGRIPRQYSFRGGETLFFGLPGNPVSTMVTFELFVRPALWKMAGRRDLIKPRIPVKLTSGVEHRPGRQEFVRATAVLDAGIWHATPTGAQGSGILGSMIGANALIDISAECGDLAAGSEAAAVIMGIHEPNAINAIKGDGSE